MGNLANDWAVRRRHELVREYGAKCGHRGCGERRHSRLEFAHVKRTGLSGTGPRGRKERMADINAHRSSYTLRCKKHHLSDFKEQHKRLRRLPRRK